MSSIFGSWGADPFAELVEKATSELLPAGQEDIALNLEICDQVRAKQVPAKQAMQTIKRRFSHKNPNVILLALGLTDICIKNGGDHFLAEVASREFMDNLASILRNPSGVNYEVKTKALRLIQNWSQIAEKKPYQMGYITETYKTLKQSGFDFPPADPSHAVSAALVETLTAPEWTDSEVCMRCRSAFTTFNRKHHCRNCGNVFCQECSSKSMSLPWFGVGQDVRVCDGCFAKKAPPKAALNSGESSKLSRSKSTITPTGRGGAGSHQRSNTLGSSSGRVGSARKREEDDIALAIKLSLEASGSTPSQPNFTQSQPTVREGRPTKQADGRMLEGTDADDDPDLAAAIAASLRDYAPPEPSAPDEEGYNTPRVGDRATHLQYESKLPLPPSLELPASDVDALLTFSQDARTQEAYARQSGRWQANATQQQQLQAEYERATAARPRMAKSLDEATRRQGVLVSMHDKLTEAVRLYDRLLDAQMNRPMYGGYEQSVSRLPNAQQYQSFHPQPYNVAPGEAVQSPLNAQQGRPHAHSSYAQETAAPGIYPSFPSQNVSSPGEGRPMYGMPNHDTLRTQQYMLPESPSPYPDHQTYFSPQNVPGYAQSPVGAMVNGEVAYRQPPAFSHAQQSLDRSQTDRYSSFSAVPSAPQQQHQPANNDALYGAPSMGSYSPAASTSVPHHAGPYYEGASSGQSDHAVPLHATMASMTLGPTGAAPGVPVGQSTVGRGAEREASQQPSAIDERSGALGDDDTGWQNVPITHSNTSVLHSAPRPPQADFAAAAPSGNAQQSRQQGENLSALPMPPSGTVAMPSAPISSPNAKQQQQRMSSNVPIAYEAVNSPPPSAGAQPWTRPVETPLIDL